MSSSPRNNLGFWSNNNTGGASNETYNYPTKGIVVNESNLLYDVFPAGFKFGCGSSAAQIEGGWTDGKSPSVWETLCVDRPDAIEDRSTCFVACDSYNRYRYDVKALKEMGCNSYKFSLSWSRILPRGDASLVNERGVDYYNRLITLLKKYDIEPIVVLWHFDLPSEIAKRMSWKEEKIVEYFVAYARVCFKMFGDRVKYWTTINAPWGYTTAAYDLGMFPPHAFETEDVYIVLHNLLTAHAFTYRMYEKEFKVKQNGRLGISIDAWGLQPASNEPDDVAAYKRAVDFRVGCCAHPLFYGKYPDSMREIIDRKSKAEGRRKSRLPVIDDKLAAIMKGSVDFLGINHYTCEMVTSSPSKMPPGAFRNLLTRNQTIGFAHDPETVNYFDPSWPTSQSWWLKFTPHALRPVLRLFRDNYGNPEIIIMENGIPGKVGNLNDIDRGNYFRAYINETLKAIKLDSCNVTGYMAWSLLDQWEWTLGHNVTYGVIHVDPNDPEKRRMFKYSGMQIKRIYTKRGFIKND